MADSYIRKFKPNIRHIAGFVLVLVSCFVFIFGFIRILRIRDPKPLDQYTVLHEGDCVKGTVDLVRFHYREASQNVYFTGNFVSEGSAYSVSEGRNGYVSYFAGKYRPFIENSTADDLDERSAEKVEFVGIVKNFSDSNFIDYVTKNANRSSIVLLGDEKVTDFSAENADTLGISAVDPAKERRFWLWGLPFLAAGILLMILGGDPYFLCAEPACK